MIEYDLTGSELKTIIRLLNGAASDVFHPDSFRPASNVEAEMEYYRNIIDKLKKEARRPLTEAREQCLVYI